MMKKRFYLLGVLMLLSVSGCEKDEGQFPDTLRDECFEEILINVNSLPIFANVDKYDWNPATKAESGDAMASLESLLDRELTEEGEVGSYRFTCIPLKEEVNNQWICMAKHEVETVSVDSLTKSKIYVITAEDIETGIKEHYVTTLIPDREYTEYFDLKDLRYLKKGNFSGIMIFSDLEGNYLGSDMIPFCAPIKKANLVIPGEDVTGEDITLYIGVEPAITKSDRHYEITTPSECISDRIIKVNLEKKEEEEEIDDDVKYVNYRSHREFEGGGGGGSSSNGSGRGQAAKRLKIESQLRHTVKLSVSGNGFASGSGTYDDGAMVCIEAVPMDSAIFVQWIGDISSKKSIVVGTITSDIVSTAYFSPWGRAINLPCLDKKTGKSNPLVVVELAPTATGNIAGATYGWTRTDENGEKKKHNGIDFATEIGTPVYAMYSGTVTMVVSGQPDRIITGYDNKNRPLYGYKTGYSGDKDGLGNRIRITTTIGSNTVTIGYCHLRAEQAVATNPRTGKPFKEGDLVYQGDRIGYAGQSGNAISVPNKHLHLDAQVNGKWNDPAPYINGNISKTDMKVTDVKCDD